MGTEVGSANIVALLGGTFVRPRRNMGSGQRDSKDRGARGFRVGPGSHTGFKANTFPDALHHSRDGTDIQTRLPGMPDHQQRSGMVRRARRCPTRVWHGTFDPL